MENSVIINQVSHDLDKVLQDCWQRLIRGAFSPRHAYHSPTIATIHNGCPEVRTVILRKVIPAESTLVFYTDFRSSKVGQLAANNNVSWLFYDPRSRIQLRLKTIATVHHQNEISLKLWKESRLESRKCYLVNPAPSTKSEFPTDGLALDFDRTNLTEESLASGYDNFAVVNCKIIEMDWLMLGRDGHARAQFVFGEKEVEKYWVVP